ncbi:MAG: hypothetical protein QOJ37_2265, partial [Pseudonocardiales bacterium]|nr:hypothetical protein [Pseudonocardiales bacterium]
QSGRIARNVGGRPSGRRNGIGTNPVTRSAGRTADVLAPALTGFEPALESAVPADPMRIAG